VQIKRLYFEVAELDQDGVKVIKPIVQINDNITAFGKKQVKAKSSTGQGNGKAKMWQHKAGEKLTASALLSKVKASNPDVVAMIEGTANVAPNRAIESLQKKNIESLAWLKEWQQVEA